MKKIFFLFTVVILAITGCKNSSVKSTVYAHGNPGDIVVVMSNERWNSESGDTLRAIFNEELPGTPMNEPIFDLHQLPVEKFATVNMHHRNIIYQEINPDIEKSTIKLIKNKYAVNQIFVHVLAKSQAEFVQIVSSNRESLIETFLEADRDRWIAQYTRHINNMDSDKIRNKYDILIKVPKNYYMEVSKDDFAWISNDTRKYSMNILIYTYPLTDSTSFTTEHLIAERNKILKENVPGENPGSYMSTEVKYDYPTLEVIEHNNQPTGILHGLWKVQGDFMGGPFVSYTKIDEPRNRVVTVEGFVYHPNEEVRDKIRLLEGIIYTFDILK